MGRLLVFCAATLLPVSALAAETQALPEACGTLAEAGDRAEGFAREMFVAKARGNLPGMRDAFTTFYSDYAAGCGAGASTEEVQPIFRAYCDFNCHLQLVEHALFMANNLEYYFGKGVSRLQGNEANGSALLAPKTMAEHVNRGLRFVESGLQLVADAGGSAATDSLGTESKEASTAGNTSFRDYVLRSATFDLHRVRLYMARGDIWYKSASDRRLQRLYQLMGNATSDPTDERDTESPYAQARLDYDSGLWALTEAQLGIPDQAEYDSLFLEGRTLGKDLRRRRNSLAKGRIFLDIDPDDYSLLNLNELDRELETLGTRMSILEDRIEKAIVAFLSAERDRKLNEVNNQEQYQQLSMSLSAYKIAKTEIEARQQRETIERSKTALEQAGTVYEREHHRAKMLYALKTSHTRMKAELDALQKKRELDVLRYDNQQEHQALSQLRWGMNWEIAKNNIEMQIDSLEAQVFRLERDLRKHELRKEQIVEDLKQLRGDPPAPGDGREATEGGRIGVALRNQQTAESSMASIDKRRTAVFQQTARALATRICEVDAQLTRLEGLPEGYKAFQWEEDGEEENEREMNCQIPEPTLSAVEYRQQRCDLADQLQQAEIQTFSDMLICVLGPDALPASVRNAVDESMQAAEGRSIADYQRGRCHQVRANCVAQMQQIDGPSEYPLSADARCNSLYERSRGVFSKKVAHIDKRIEKVQEIKKLLADALKWLDSDFANSVTASLAQASAAVGNLVAQTTTAKKGLKLISSKGFDVHSGSPAVTGTTQRDLSLEKAYYVARQGNEMLKAAYQITRTESDAAQVVFRWKQQRASMDAQIVEMKKTLEELDLERDLALLGTAEAMMEMTKDGLDLSSRLQGALQGALINKLDCNSATDDLTSEISRLRYQREYLLAELNRANYENDLLDHEYDRHEASLANEKATEQILRSQVRQQEIELQRVQEDIVTIQGDPENKVSGLLERYQGQIARLQTMGGRLDQIASENTRISNAIETLDSQIFAQTVALKDDEIGLVKRVIDSNESHTDETLRLLEEIREKQLASEEQTMQLHALYASTTDAIHKERTNMLKTAEHAMQDNQCNRRDEVFVSNETILTELVRGVPMFLTAKQALVERANRSLAMLNNRLRAVFSLTDANVRYGLSDATQPTEFLRTHGDIQTARDALHGEAIDRQALVLSEVISIVVPRESGLARQLATEQRATFAISPTSQEEMVRLGHYVLWHPALDDPMGQSIIDMELVVEFDGTGDHCMSRRFTLRHGGAGYRFVHGDDGKVHPVFVVGKSRSHDPVYYKTAGDKRLEAFTEFWRDEDHSVFGFYRGTVSPPDDREGMLPLLGVPVAGIYEIELPSAQPFVNTDVCTYENASFRLVIAYARVQ